MASWSVALATCWRAPSAASKARAPSAKRRSPFYHGGRRRPPLRPCSRGLFTGDRRHLGPRRPGRRFGPDPVQQRRPLAHGGELAAGAVEARASLDRRRLGRGALLRGPRAGSGALERQVGLLIFLVVLSPAAADAAMVLPRSGARRRFLSAPPRAPAGRGPARPTRPPRRAPGRRAPLGLRLTAALLEACGDLAVLRDDGRRRGLERLTRWRSRASAASSQSRLSRASICSRVARSRPARALSARAGGEHGRLEGHLRALATLGPIEQGLGLLPERLETVRVFPRAPQARLEGGDVGRLRRGSNAN